MNISIFGAGITGLTSAYALAKSGHKVTVYESGPAEGGLASTFSMGPYKFDYGPHEFISTSPPLLSLMQVLLGNDFIRIEQKAAQHFLGRYVHYPLKPHEVFRALPIGASMRIGCEIILKKFEGLFANPRDYSFESWVVNRFGRTMYNMYFGPYTSKVWGINPDLLDPRTASDRISFDSLFDFFWKACAHYFVRQDDYTSRHSPMHKYFHYVRGGIAGLSRSLVKACGDLGVVIKPSHSLAEIRMSNGRIGSVMIKGANGDCVEVISDYYVSSIPLPNLCRLLGIGLPNIRFRDMVFVFLSASFKCQNKFQWIYTPSRDVLFQRVTDYSLFNADMCPEGHAAIGLEIASFEGDELWNSDDDAIIKRCNNELQSMSVIGKDQMMNGAVKRVKYAYPLQTIGYIEQVQEVLSQLQRIPNMASLGRQGQFKYCNMDECMEMALEHCEMMDRHESYHYSMKSKWKGAGIK